MSEILELQSQKIDLLTRTVLRNITSLKQTYGWWSSYYESPIRNIPPLVQMMQTLRSKISVENLKFLDCGSGDGVVAVAAALGGFKKVHGIEISGGLMGLSQNIIAPFAKDFDISITEGSYYIPEYLHFLVPKCIEELRRRFSQEMIDFNTFEEYARSLLELPEDADNIDQSVATYLVPNTKKNPYLESGLIGDRGELNADVVYIYPSDIFFEAAFLPQMAHAMRKDTHLAVFSPSDDMDFQLPSVFQEVTRIPVQLSEAESMGLRLCQKVE